MTRRNKRHHGDGEVIPKEINVRGNNAQELLHVVIDALLTDHPDIQIESVEFEELDTEETGCVPAADNSIAWGCPPQVASSAPPARPLRQRDPVGVIVTSTSWTSRPAYLMKRKTSKRTKGPREQGEATEAGLTAEEPTGKATSREQGEATEAGLTAEDSTSKATETG